jgi:threonine dehydrogenase-like Zn-dependent dehydrogenase
MRVLVAGAGAVGARAARQLASSLEVSGVAVSDRSEPRASAVTRSLGPSAWVAAWGEAGLDGIDAVVAAAPDCAALVESAVHRRLPVSTGRRGPTASPSRPGQAWLRG